MDDSLLVFDALLVLLIFLVTLIKQDLFFIRYIYSRKLPFEGYLLQTFLTELTIHRACAI